MLVRILPKPGSVRRRRRQSSHRPGETWEVFPREGLDRYTQKES